MSELQVIRGRSVDRFLPQNPLFRLPVPATRPDPIPKRNPLFNQPLPRDISRVMQTPVKVTTSDQISPVKQQFYDQYQRPVLASGNWLDSDTVKLTSEDIVRQMADIANTMSGPIVDDSLFQELKLYMKINYPLKKVYTGNEVLNYFQANGIPTDQLEPLPADLQEEFVFVNLPNLTADELKAYVFTISSQATSLAYLYFTSRKEIDNPYRYFGEDLVKPALENAYPEDSESEITKRYDNLVKNTTSTVVVQPIQINSDVKSEDSEESDLPRFTSDMVMLYESSVIDINTTLISEGSVFITRSQTSTNRSFLYPVTAISDTQLTYEGGKKPYSIRSVTQSDPIHKNLRVWIKTSDPEIMTDVADQTTSYYLFSGKSISNLAPIDLSSLKLLEYRGVKIWNHPEPALRSMLVGSGFADGNSRFMILDKKVGAYFVYRFSL